MKQQQCLCSEVLNLGLMQNLWLFSEKQSTFSTLLWTHFSRVLQLVSPWLTIHQVIYWNVLSKSYFLNVEMKMAALCQADSSWKFSLILKRMVFSISEVMENSINILQTFSNSSKNSQQMESREQTYEMAILSFSEIWSTFITHLLMNLLAHHA